MSCGVGCRCGLDLALLWLWLWLAATAPIRPLAWESPCAAGVALKRQKKKKKRLFSAEEEGRFRENSVEGTDPFWDGPENQGSSERGDLDVCEKLKIDQIGCIPQKAPQLLRWKGTENSPALHRQPLTKGLQPSNSI